MKSFKMIYFVKCKENYYYACICGKVYKNSCVRASVYDTAEIYFKLV
jgi:hypothetical protein